MKKTGETDDRQLVVPAVSLNPNPYSPPTTDVDAERIVRIARRRPWRIYAFFLSGLCGLTYAYSFATDFRAILLPDLFFTSVGLTGLFGFAFRKPVLRSQLWIAWAILLAAWDVLFNFVLDRSHGETSGTLGTALPLLLVVPEYVALWRYGFSSPDIWERA